MSPDETERRYLDELLVAMRSPCTETLSPGGLSAVFAREFRATLLIHHYFLKAPLATSSFEAAYVRAAQAAGHEVEIAPDGGRFWDVRIDGLKVSLKSTGAAGLKDHTLHVSKLCEAAWIQDMRGAAQREERTKALFEEYTNTVDGIVQLRFFRKRAFYELVRIPGAILRQVADVARSEFAPDGPTIGIPVGKNPPDFTLKLDRSDAKITLANINKDVCEVLGSWQLDDSAELNAPPPTDH